MIQEKRLYTELPIEEQNEDEQIVTIGDDILSQFYYGNYTDAIQMLLESNSTPEELGEYLEEVAEEFDMKVSELYNGHFTYSFMGAIGETFGNAICRGAA